MEITINGTQVTITGDRVIGFQLNNLVNRFQATTDLTNEWDYQLYVHMVVPDLYNKINLNWEEDSQVIYVDLTADMLPYSGRYEMQFVATNGDYVSHTDIFEVFVKNTLDPVKQYTPVPSEFYQIQKDVQQNAQLAQSSANQAEQSATDAEGYAIQAQQSAQDASEYLAQVQESANEASQSATQAAESATQAAQSAQTAQTAVDSIGDSVQQAQTAANNAQQSATQAGTSATQAQESATQAQGYATTAGNSATSAQQSATSAQQSAANAGQSATQAQTSATQASTSATQASESETNAAESATQAQQFASAAQQSATSASESASEASSSAQQAASSATAAQNAQQAIENMTVFATTLAPGSDASVTKTTDQGIVNLEFGIPQGEKGDAGLGVPVPTVDDANDVPVVNSTGTAYELQPYTNDNAVGANPWSSKQIVDSFCPPFTTSGSVVTCNPVVNYPLSVQSEIVAVQSGSGDPSPENVRPISGWSEVTLTHNDTPVTIQFGQTVYGGELDWTTGVLTVTYANTMLGDSSIDKYSDKENTYAYVTVPPNSAPFAYSKAMCSSLARIGSASSDIEGYSNGDKSNRLYFRILKSRLTDGTVATLKDWLQENPIQFVYLLDEPQTIQLTPQEILALSGTNNIYADTGDTTVSGRQDLINYLQSLSSAVLGG